MPALRPCLGCGGLTRAARCLSCAIPRPTLRERRPEYTYAERVRRAEVVRAWVEEHGSWCPGYHVPPHSTPDLTADHVIPVAAGGDEHGELTVLCRSCNGRKQHRIDMGGGEGGRGHT